MAGRFAGYARPTNNPGFNHLQQNLFFINKGTQRGATHDIFMEFERSLNQKLAKEKKLKHRHLKVRIIFVPVARDQLISALNAGKGMLSPLT